MWSESKWVSIWLLTHLQAWKLAERTIQCADVLTLVSAGHIHAGYLSQKEHSLPEALRHFTAAIKSNQNNQKNVLAALGLAQAQLESGMFISVDTVFHYHGN